MLTARDIMTTSVQTVAARMPIREFALLLATQHLNGTPVLSDDGAVIGMATEADLLAKSGATVGEIMTRRPISVEEKTPVAEVAQLLGCRRIRQAPVMRGGRLVGMVSRRDIVRAIARASRPEAVLGIKA